MTEEGNSTLERQARHVAKLGLTSVEHMEAVIDGARQLLETGAIVPPPDEENPYLPQPYAWQLSERRDDLPRRLWLGTVEEISAEEGHSVYFVANFARDEDEFRRNIAVELGSHLAHDAKVGAGVDSVPFTKMFLPEKLATMLAGFDQGEDPPAVMSYFAKYHGSFS